MSEKLGFRGSYTSLAAADTYTTRSSRNLDLAKVGSAADIRRAISLSKVDLVQRGV